MAGTFRSIFKRKEKEILSVPEHDKPLMRVLEPRVLLDAAAVETALDIAGQAAHSQLADDYVANSRTVENMDDESVDATQRQKIADAPPLAPEPVAGEAFVDAGEAVARRTDNEIVFIDAGVPNREELIASLEPGVTVHILDATSDGVQQIADILANSKGYDAVHIFSHGVAGALQLGSGELNGTSISGSHADALKTIGAALSNQGDILIYGCDFGQGEEGRIAAAKLAAATGADIAASDDLTGSESLAGDWDLEVQTGKIESQSFSAPNWQGILAGYTIDAEGAPDIGHRDSGVVGTAGTTATWADAVKFDNGTPNPDLFDIRATIVGLSDNTSATFETADVDGTGLDDFRVVVTNIGAEDPDNPAPGALETGSVTVRWEIFEAGTLTPASADQINILLTDITGNAGLAASGETVIIESDQLTEYTVDGASDLDVGAASATVFVSGTTLSAGDRSQINVQFEDSNRFVLTYVSRTLVTEFDMVGNDGAGSFAAPVTQDAQFIDLNGTADGGTDYTAFYVNGSSFGSAEDVPLSIVDLDLAIFDLDNTELAGATITLNNAYAGDQLNYDETLLNNLGLDVTLTVVPGTGGAPDSHILQLNGLLGTVRISNILTALQSITYSNPLPDTAVPPAESFNRIDARIIDISITDGVQTSMATTTVAITTAGNAPVTGNNVYVEDEDMAITTDFANGLIGDDRDKDTADLDVVSVTDSNGIALIDEIVGGVSTGYLINPTDPGTGDSLLTSGATLRVLKADGSFTYTPAPFYNGNEVFSYVVTDGTFNTEGFATFDIQPVANAVTLDVVAPDPGTDPGTPEDQQTASISISSSSPDAKETQLYMALDIPIGVILTDGTNSFMADDDLQEIDITNWDRTQLRALPVENSDREIDIEFLVINFEIDDTSSEDSRVVTFKVNAVADRPTLIVNEARAAIDEDVNLSSVISPQLFDVDGSEEITDITISNIPSGAVILVDNTPRPIVGGVVVLSRVDLQTLVFRPPQNGLIITYNMLVSATSTESMPNGGVVLATATESNVALTVILNDETEPVIAVDDTAVSFAGQAVTINVLGNDSVPDGTPGITEVNGQPIDVPTPVVLPGGEGTVYLTPLNELRFEAAPLFSGQVQFTYTVQDIDLDEDTAIVTVNVQPRWSLSGDTNVVEDGGGVADFDITIEGAVQQGQSISTQVIIQDGTASVDDHETLATAINRSIAGPPGQPDYAFDGSTLTYTAPDANYVSTYDAGGSAFLDIQATGTRLTLSDDGSQATSIGFDFSFYGNSFDTAFVSANGYLTFGSPAAGATNESLDGAALAGRPVIAPYWDDLDPSTGGVFVEHIVDVNGKEFFVAQWEGVTNKNGGGTGSFQVIIERASGAVRYNYRDIDFGNAGDNGAQATIGLQSTTGVADEFSFNQADNVVSGSSILFDRGATVNPVFNINLNITDDPDFEVAETFALKLQNPIGAALSTDLVEVTIDVSDNLAPTAVADTGTVNETGILITNLIDPNNAGTGEAGEDSDPEGHTLSFASVNGVNIGAVATVVPLGGGSSLVVDPNGEVTYDPNGKFAHLTVGQSAFETFEYFVKDQYGAISATPATVTIEVLGENQAPDIDFNTNITPIVRSSDVEYLPAETNMLLLGADVGIVDPDDTSFANLTLTLGGFVQPLEEVVSIGGLSFIHGSVGRTDPVVINAVTYSVTYDGANQLVITLDGGGEMTSAQVNEVMRAIGYENTSLDDTPGIRTFALTANDGSETGLASTINVDVVGNNTAPVAQDDGVPTPYVVVEEGSVDIAVADLMANDFDLDIGDSISFDAVQDGPDGSASYNAMSGDITFTPNADFAGATTFTYAIRDIKGTIGTGTVHVNVLPINDAPRVDLNGGIVGNDYSFDYDENGPLTPIVSPAASVVDVDSALMTRMDIVLTNGQIGDRLRLDAVPGSIVAQTIPGDDGNGLNSAGTITIRFSGNATPLEYETALKAISFENTTDTPDETARTIEITALDDVFAQSILATTTINVDAQNDAPNAVADSGYQLDEDVFIAIAPSSLLANDSDAEDDNLTIVSVQNPQPGGTVGFNGPGDVVFIPPPDYFGPATFTYTVSDGNGGMSDATVNLLVRGVNDVTFIDLDANTVGQDFSTTYEENQVPISIVDPTFVISDVDDTQMEGATIFLSNGRASDVLTMTATSPDITVSILPAVPLAGDGPVLIQLSGTASNADYLNVISGITFHADTEAPVETQRTITVKLNDGIDESNVATTTISVTAVNDAPEANPDAGLTTDEDVARTIVQSEILGNDFDPDLEPINLVSVQDAVNGSVVLNGDGTITFTPTPNYFGPASFTYTIEDAALVQATATVDLTVTSINDVAQIDLDTNTGGRNYTTSYNEDDAVGVALVDASVAFTDVDDTDLEGATLTLTDGQIGDEIIVGALPGGITATVVPVGALTFAQSVSVVFTGRGTLAEYQTALEAVRYTSTSQAPTLVSDTRDVEISVNDGDDDSNIANTTVNVIASNDDPIVGPDTFTIDEDTPLQLAPAALLLNDADPDGDAFATQSVGTAVNGSVSLVGGQVRFVPDADFAGTASFEYTLTDGNGGTATGVVTVEVTPINDAPTADLNVANLGSTSYATAYTEGDTPVAIAGPGMAFGDIDDSELEQMLVTLTNGQIGDLLTIGALPPGITVDGVVPPALTAPGMVTVTLTGSASFADYQTALQAIGYSSVSNDPSGVNRTFSVIVSDGSIGSDPVISTVAVTPVNDAPVAGADGIFTFNEDEIFTRAPADFLGNDTDGENDALRITTVGSAVNGTVSFVGGVITFTPDADYFGPASFEYTVTDEIDTSTGVVTLDITSVNDAPDLDLDTGNAGIGFATTFIEDAGAVSVVDPSILINDVDNAQLTGATIFLANGQVGDFLSVGALPGGIVATVTPVDPLTTLGPVTVELSGAASFADYQTALFGITYNTVSNAPVTSDRSLFVTVNDGLLNSEAAQTTLTVIGVNDAPTALDDNPAALDEDTNYQAPAVDLLLNDSDFEGDALTVIGVHTPINGSVTLSFGGMITFIPDANYFGPASFEYDVRDAVGGVSTAVVNLVFNSVNDVTTIDLDTLNPGTGYLTTYVENDAGAVLADASLVVQDVDSPDLASATFTLTNGLVGDILEVGALPPGINANIVPAAALTIDSTITVTLSGVASQADYVLAMQAVTFRSNSENPNTTARSISITVNDGVDESAPVNAVVALTAVNDAPTAVADGPLTVPEDTLLEIPVGDLLANDTDPENDALTIVSVQDPTNGAVVLGADSIVRFTPDAAYFGPASFTYTVRDTAGLTSTQTVNIDVTFVNDAPILDLNGAGTEGSNFEATYDENAAGIQVVDPTVSIFDEDHAVLVDIKVVLTNGQAGDILELGLLPGTMSATVVPGTGLGAPGVITITFSGNAPIGDYETALQAITYRSTSENPSTAPRVLEVDAFDGFDRSLIATSTININSINDAPDAVNDGVPIALVVQEDVPFTFNPVQANDSDVEDDTLSITEINGLPIVPGGSVPLVGAGSVVLDADGQTLTYQPTLNFFGPVNFTYTLSDGGLTDVASVNLNVVPVNDAPTAVDDGPVVLVEDTNVTFDPITGSDSDVEGDLLNIVSIDGQAIFPLGAVNTADGRIELAPDGRTLVFTPAADFAGISTVVYGVSDGLDVSTATITFDVTPVDDPLAVISTPPTQSFDDGEVINLPLAPFIYDPDGDALLFTQTGLPAGLSINASTGVISGVIASDASQTSPYTVTITVGDGVSSTESFNFQIDVDNVAPVAESRIVKVAEGASFIYDTKALFSDADGDALTFDASGLPSWLTFDATTAILSGVVPADASVFGLQTITLSANDGEGGSVITTLSIDPVNEAPVVLGSVNDLIVREGDAVNVSLAGVFADGGADSDQLTISVANLPAGLSFDATNKRITGTVATGAAAFENFEVTVTATDGQGGTATEKFKITVNAASVAVVANEIKTDESNTSVITANPFIGTVATGSNGNPVQSNVPVGEFDLNQIFVDEDDEKEKDAGAATFSDLVDDDVEQLTSNDIVFGINSLVNQIADLGSTTSLSDRNGVLLSAISAIDPLLSVNSSGSTSDLPEQLSIGGEIPKSTDWLTSSGRAGNGDWDVSGSDGFTSLWEGKRERDAVSRDDRLTRFSLDITNRQGVLFIEFKNKLDILRDGTVVRSVLSLPDGKPLPEWMKLVREGFIEATIPQGQKDFFLQISVTLGNGNQLEKVVRVDVENGKVVDAEPEDEKKQEKPSQSASTIEFDTKQLRSGLTTGHLDVDIAATSQKEPQEA